jgi:hypothetical protein
VPPPETETLGKPVVSYVRHVSLSVLKEMSPNSRVAASISLLDKRTELRSVVSLSIVTTLKKPVVVTLKIDDGRVTRNPPLSLRT